VKIICISDTHGDHDQVQVPDGDVLVHAGDVTAHGTKQDFEKFIDWFSGHSHQHKLFIAGNHDSYLEQHPEQVVALAKLKNVAYLNDSGVEVEGVNFWGSPITPRFLDWAFMRDVGSDIEKHWNLIPAATDILITHGPVWGVLDEVERSETLTENTGCPSLLKTVEKVQPAFHVFGHIHEGYGSEQRGLTSHLNVSTMNKAYRIHNKPVLIDYPN